MDTKKGRSFDDIVECFRKLNEKWENIDQLPYGEQLGARIRKVDELSKEKVYELLEEVRAFMVSDASWDEKHSVLSVSRVLLDHIKDEYGVEEKLKVKK